eukprot:6447870-Amphidinium_carterae.1
MEGPATPLGNSGFAPGSPAEKPLRGVSSFPSGHCVWCEAGHLRKSLQSLLALRSSVFCSAVLTSGSVSPVIWGS